MMPRIIYNEPEIPYNKTLHTWVYYLMCASFIMVTPVIQYCFYLEFELDYESKNPSRSLIATYCSFIVLNLILSFTSLFYLFDGVRRIYRSERDDHKELFWKNEKPLIFHLVSLSLIMLLYTVVSLISVTTDVGDRRSFGKITTTVSILNLIAHTLVFFVIFTLLVILDRIIHRYKFLEFQVQTGHPSARESDGPSIEVDDNTEDSVSLIERKASV